MTKPPFVYEQRITRRGRVYVYYRFRRHGISKRLPGKPGDAAFHEEYARLTRETSAAIGIRAGTLQEIIRLYEKSQDFQRLKPATRRLYMGNMNRLNAAKIGQTPLENIKRSTVLAVRDKLAATPGSANSMLATLGVLFEFARDRDRVAVNPVQGVKRFKGGEGYRRWTNGDLQHFRDTAKAMMVLAMELGLYTGQRMSDVIRMTWSDYDGKAIRVRQKKTGKRLVIPCHKALRAILNDETRIGIAILTTPTGRPFAERGFSAAFLKARLAAKLEHLHFHGLRHTAAAKLKEAGCTTGEIQSITGQSLAMVEHYTKQADQEQVASAAIIKLERNES